MNIKTEELLDFSSDYTHTIYTIDQKVTKDEKTKLTNATTDWIAYAEYINKNLNCNIPLKNAIDIEKAAETLTSTLKAAALHKVRGGNSQAYENPDTHTRTNQNQKKSKETMAKHNTAPI